MQKVMARGDTPAGTHRPICVREILEVLDPRPGEVGLDATLGFGGHAQEILPRLMPGGRLFGIDVDPVELPRTEARLRGLGFSEDVLAELDASARRTVRIGPERVLLEHLYTERRVTPLNLYLQNASDDEALHALLDYGSAIRDLAAANIFPGDLLLKNFGVTRHGRVIFYDYDEVDHLTDICFREMPEARNHEDEMADVPWFHVGEHDVFPEEFLRFLGLPRHLLGAFLDAHGDLFTVTFWRDMQRRQSAGEILDFFPYPQSRRLDRLPDRSRP